MSETKTEYYLIRGYILGKKENDRYFICRDGKWEPDTRNIILDTMFGYSSSEGPDSPYGMFDTDIMDELKHISREEAEAIIHRRTNPDDSEIKQAE